MKINPRVMLKVTEKFTIDNSPTILTAVGVVGTVGTAFLTYRAASEAAYILFAEDAKKRLDGEPPLTNQEILKLTWKLYWSPALAGTLTVASIIAANRIGAKRAAALAAAYALSEKTISEYKDKVVEKIGPKKEQAIRDEVAQDAVNKNPVSQNQVYITGGGEVLCYDKYVGRYFMSTMETLRKAQNDVIQEIIHNGYSALNDFYMHIGLSRVGLGEEMGWSLDHPLEIEYSTTMSDDNRPCIVIDYRVIPTRGLCLGG